MEFEKVLHKCGDYSRYQFLLLVSFGVLNIFCAWHYFAQTIVGFTPPHWCFHESLLNLSFVDIEAIYSKFERPSCTKLKLDGLESFAASEEKCTEWVYKYDFGYKSISAEVNQQMNWVCDDAYKLAVGQSFFFIGSVIGTVLFGLLADRIGRLPTMIMANLAGCVGDFTTSYTSSLPEFASCRLISGMATDTCFYLMYIMVFEYIRPSKRTLGLNIITGVFYCFGLVIIPWMAVFTGNWRRFLFFESIPIATVGFYGLFLCESAQWLITRKDYDGAVKCLKHVAKFNRRNVEASVFDEFEKYCKTTIQSTCEKHTDDNFLGMFRTPHLRKTTIILLIKSMIITISFDIVGKNVEGLGTSPFILFSLTSLVYIPAALSIICLQNRIGRKGMACISLFMCSIFTMAIGIAISYIDSFQNAMTLALLAAISRYGTVVAYDAEAQYAAELIPTSVRGQGVAIIHVVGYLFSFLSAYILYMGNDYKSFPSIFVSAIMLIGSLLCLFLPETVNKTLPNYLSEGEQFARNEKWFQFRVSSTNKKDSSP